MTRLGKALVTDIEIVSVDETIRRIEAVAADDVAALARGVPRARARSPRPGSARKRAASAPPWRAVNPRSRSAA